MAYRNNVYPGTVHQYEWRTSALWGWQNGSWSESIDTIEMDSTNHFPLNTETDDGGPWFMLKSAHNYQNARIDTTIYHGLVTFGGNRDPGYSNQSLSAPVSDDALKVKGTTMIARSLPNDSQADLAVGMAELVREGVPSILGLQTLKERSRLAHNAGSEYLNLEFGWKPLVSEVQSLAKAVRNSEQTWAAYRKGGGQKTRVGYHLDDVSTTRISNGPWIVSPVHANATISGTEVQTKRDHTWFAGAFKYHVPEPVDLPSKFSYWSSQANKILGVRLTPDVLWNLAPWSWCIDWFTNTGDVIKNISLLGKDAMVMQYGYAMAEQHVKTSRSGNVVGKSVGYEHLAKRCRRISASPYGFGVTYDSLSSRQVAILAALGISRW